MESTIGIGIGIDMVRRRSRPVVEVEWLIERIKMSRLINHSAVSCVLTRTTPPTNIEHTVIAPILSMWKRWEGVELMIGWEGKKTVKGGRTEAM
jgi:hypothetical protein